MRAERGLPENLIRLCVGIEDPRDLVEDLEHSLISSGAIVPNYSHSIKSNVESEELYGADREAWIIDRAKAFRRPEVGAMERLVNGVKLGLNLVGIGDVERKMIEEDIVVSAPGKVILFGEHAVVHGVVSEILRFGCVADVKQTAIATSLNLRCFAVLSPRSDDKVGLEVPNLGLEAEWTIPALPWSLLPVGSDGAKREADKELDQPLLQAIESLVETAEITNVARGAEMAFLYLYMVTAGNDKNASVAHDPAVFPTSPEAEHG